MIEYLIPFVSACSPLFVTFCIPVLCVALIAFVGRFIHFLLRS